jgi:hypothetical protein
MKRKLTAATALAAAMTTAFLGCTGAPGRVGRTALTFVAFVIKGTR